MDGEKVVNKKKKKIFKKVGSEKIKSKGSINLVLYFTGTIWTDFSPQIVGFNPDEFSMIVWDPPGYGNSRPPERDFTPGYLERDADLIVKLLKVCYTSIS